MDTTEENAKPPLVLQARVCINGVTYGKDANCPAAFEMVLRRMAQRDWKEVMEASALTAHSNSCEFKQCDNPTKNV